MKMYSMALAVVLVLVTGCSNLAVSPVSDVADRIEILDLLNRHQIYIDAGDAQGYASLYAGDGTYESPFGTARGTQALIDFFNQAQSSGFTEGKRHMGGPVTIDLDGEEASAVAYYWVAETKQFPPVIVATGAYTDRLRKIDGQWKIVRRRQVIDPNWLLGQPQK